MTVPGSDIKWIQWHRVARNYQMRIGTNKKRQTFDGFLKDDFERLGNLCKQVCVQAAALAVTSLSRT